MNAGKLRLLLFKKCNRDCNGCCNKEWDLKSLPVEDDFRSYDEVNLTGGEPMLNWTLILKITALIRKQSNAKVYVYTAKLDKIANVVAVLGFVDGITVTLHDKSDVADFEILNRYILAIKPNKSLRLNVFRGVTVNLDLSAWIVKDDVVWIKNCPLPENETFKRINVMSLFPEDS